MLYAIVAVLVLILDQGLKYYVTLNIPLNTGSVTLIPKVLSLMNIHNTGAAFGMLGGGANLLIGDLIELQFLGNSYNLNLGSAMSLVLMVIVLLCMSFTSSFDEEEMEGVM